MSEQVTPSSSTEVPKKSFDLTFLLISAGVAILGSIIGIQLITSLGITPNTSIIGVLIAIIIARIPLRAFMRFRNIHNQNLIQTTISAATFGAANSLMIPIGIPYVLGMPDLVWPMLFGAGFALTVDVFVLYKLFDSKLFGADEVWPVGVASAEALKAGDAGGKKAKLLGVGIAGGAVGAHFGVSMSAFGVAFIGNIWALGFFGVGLLSRAYSDPLFGIDIDALYVPHGMMVGAGVVALGQFVVLLIRSRRKTKAETLSDKDSSDVDALRGPKATSKHQHTRDERDVRTAFMIGGGLYLTGALLVALTGGLVTELSGWQVVFFLLFAAAATFATEIIVGIAAMHSGWFPAFAVTLIMLIVGLLIGFPPVALALLTGYVAATGPAFADMGYDLKTGSLIRKGMTVQQELYGRRQQLKAGVIGFAVAFGVVTLAHNSYFSQGLFAPVNEVYAATIEAGISSDVGRLLLLSAVPGALVQLIGGTKRQIGVMFATGLLILNPLAGWAVIAGITLRVVILRIRGEQAQNTMYTVAAGVIAGDALYSFFSSLWKARA